MSEHHVPKPLSSAKKLRIHLSHVSKRQYPTLFHTRPHGQVRSLVVRPASSTFSTLILSFLIPPWLLLIALSSSSPLLPCPQGCKPPRQPRTPIQGSPGCLLWELAWGVSCSRSFCIGLGYRSSSLSVLLALGLLVKSQFFESLHLSLLLFLAGERGSSLLVHWTNYCD